MSKQEWPTYAISNSEGGKIYFYPHYTRREVDELAQYLYDAVDESRDDGVDDNPNVFRLSIATPPNFTPAGYYFLRVDLVPVRVGAGKVKIEYRWSVELIKPETGRSHKKSFGGFESDPGKVIRFCVRTFGYEWGNIYGARTLNGTGG